jgi:hypothetical protein
MSYSSYYPFHNDPDRGSIAIIVEIHGTSGEQIGKLNEEKEENPAILRTCNFVDSAPDSPYSAKETPTPEEDVSAWYAALTSLRIEGPLLFKFGKSHHAHIRLKGATGLSGIHFHVFASQFRTWMVECRSNNRMYLNGILLGKGEQRAMIPFEPNYVQYRAISLRIRITHETVEIPSSLFPSLYTRRAGLGHGINDTVSEASESATGSTVTLAATTAQFEQPITARSDFILLKQLPVASEKNACRAIRAKTGQQCVAVLYPTDQDSAFVSDILRKFLPLASVRTL